MQMANFDGQWHRDNRQLRPLANAPYMPKETKRIPGVEVKWTKLKDSSSDRYRGICCASL
jgi:hypothetical protein